MVDFDGVRLLPRRPTKLARSKTGTFANTTDKRQHVHQNKQRITYPDKNQHGIGHNECAEHRADIQCAYKCTNLEDDQCV
jgi:hypothetical protein